jgi:nucleoside-triphosphatase THEP1
MFKKAVKSQAKLRMALCGPAGAGKTFTALQLAAHLGEKVAVIDTEHGSASKYADRFAFDVCELNNFNPNNYIAAIKDAEAAGYNVIVIDSMSHAWNGEGGVRDVVDAAAARMKGNSYVGWKEGTPLQNRFIETILQSRCHVIATMRAKTEYVQEKDERGKTVIRKVGMAPVQRDGVEYEFDVVGDLDVNNTLTVTKTRCAELTDAVIRKPGRELADKLKAWLTDGEVAPARPVAPTEPEPQARPQVSADADDTAFKLALSLIEGSKTLAELNGHAKEFAKLPQVDRNALKGHYDLKRRELMQANVVNAEVAQ